MSAEGVVIGAPGARISLIASGDAKAPANADFATDFPAMLTYEVGTHSGTHEVELVGTPTKYAFGFADSLQQLLKVSAETTRPHWRAVTRWPFIEKAQNGLPSAYLLSAGGELHVAAQALDVRGHIKVDVTLKPFGRAGNAALSFDWDIDQSYLPALMSDLRREFPGL